MALLKIKPNISSDENIFHFLAWQGTGTRVVGLHACSLRCTWLQGLGQEDATDASVRSAE